MSKGPSSKPSEIHVNSPAQIGSTAVYVRCAAQDANGEELRKRTAKTQAVAAAHGLSVETKNVIAEYGSGAELMGRPGLASLLKQAEAGQGGTLVVTSLSRLGCDIQTMTSIMDTLKKGGVTVLTTDSELSPSRIG